jgi:hypothetical protein
MAKKYLLLTNCLAALACGTTYEPPDTAIDTGRQFINATYQGNFKRAYQLIEPTESNMNTLKNRIEADFRSRDGFGKEALSKSSIQIQSIETLADKSVKIKFTNAYTAQPDSLLVVPNGDSWQVRLY